MKHSPRREKEKKKKKDGYFSVESVSVTHSCGVHAVMLTDAMQRMMTLMEKSVKGLPKQL